MSQLDRTKSLQATSSILLSDDAALLKKDVDNILANSQGQAKVVSLLQRSERDGVHGYRQIASKLVTQ